MQKSECGRHQTECTGKPPNFPDALLHAQFCNLHSDFSRLPLNVFVGSAEVQRRQIDQLHSRNSVKPAHDLWLQ